MTILGFHVMSHHGVLKLVLDNFFLRELTAIDIPINWFQAHFGQGFVAPTKALAAQKGLLGFARSQRTGMRR